MRNVDNYDSYFANTKEKGEEESFQRYLEEMAESEYSKGDSRYKTESDAFEEDYGEYVSESKDKGFDAGSMKYLEEMAESEYSKCDSRYSQCFATDSNEQNQNIEKDIKLGKTESAQRPFNSENETENTVLKSVPYIPDIFIEPRVKPDSQKALKNKEVDSRKESYHNKGFEGSEESCFNRNMRVCFEEFWEAYPNKIEKNSAAIEYMGMFKGERTHYTIMNALKECKRSKQWKKGSGKLIPPPEKWLSDLKNCGKFF